MSTPNLHLFSSMEVSQSSLRALGIYTSNAFHVPKKALPRILFHAIILSLIIASFWLMDSLKDPIIARVVGIEYQPLAKVASVVTTLVVTCAYDNLTSILSKADLFHALSAFFGVAFMFTSAILSDPEIGLRSDLDKSPYRLLGWFTYILIEAYGSLMVVLFWSFTNSVMDLEVAKGAYGLIIGVAQFGAIAGSTLATNSKSIGISMLFLCAALSIFSISLLVKVYHIVYRRTGFDAAASGAASDGRADSTVRRRDRAASVDEEALLVGESASHHLTEGPQGFLHGLRLLVSDRYLLLLLGVSCLYEVVVTVLDYQFKILGAAKSSDPATAASASVAEDQFANLLGHFGQATNLFSFLMSFFGFSLLVHRLGVRNSLLILPIVLLLAVIITNLEPTLWVLFIAVSVVKALVFSLHDPVKELLYIPTSSAVKFKAKAWIDVFGSRLAKATGSLVSYVAHGDAALLRTISEVPCLILSVAVIALAFAAGNEFDRKVMALPGGKAHALSSAEL